jgi:hypothetical protein
MFDLEEATLDRGKLPRSWGPPEMTGRIVQAGPVPFESYPSPSAACKIGFEARALKDLVGFSAFFAGLNDFRKSRHLRDPGVHSGTDHGFRHSHRDD